MADSADVPDRVGASFGQLKDVAARLNSVSDKLGAVVSQIDGALRDLNLGIETWHRFGEGDDPTTGEEWWSAIGYARIRSKWGIALQKGTGNYNHGQWDTEEWMFNDAPRALRVEGIQELPDLLDQLTKTATETVEKVKSGIDNAKQIAAALNPTAKSGK